MTILCRFGKMCRATQRHLQRRKQTSAQHCHGPHWKPVVGFDGRTNHRRRSSGQEVALEHSENVPRSWTIYNFDVAQVKTTKIHFFAQIID